MIPVAAAAFFASGFAALLYQVIWQRLLVLFSGADLYSVTIIVAAFMGGMGAGHLAGGHLADRVSARTSLLLFAAAELAIAIFGVFSRPLYYDVLYNRLGDLRIPPPALAALLFVSLLWPTFFMGASLPLLSRALADRIERAASVIGLLYGINTLGAAVGALLSTWVLLPRLGLDGSLRIGVSLNIACAVVLLPTTLASTRFRAARASSPAAGHDEHRDRDDAEGGTTFGFGTWALIFACSGLLALALEIVWFRLLAVTMKGTAFTFGTLLGVYLTGIGLGALAGSVIAPRVRRPAVVFLLLQAAVGMTAMALLTVFVRGADEIPVLWTYLGSYEPLDVREAVGRLAAFTAGDLATTSEAAVPMWKFLALYFGVPALLVLPPTLLMGCSFPVLQRVVQTSLPRVGRRVGVLLLANVAGSMVGTVLTGWVLLDRIGTAGTMKLLAAMSGAFAVLAFRLGRHAAVAGAQQRLPSRSALALAAAVMFVPLLAIMPPSDTLWAHLHGAIVEQMIHAEDGSGLSVINTDGRNAVLFANGIGQGVIPYGDVHTALGALPAFLHPSPRTAAVIGLGSGDTVHAVAGRREIERVTCVEIIRGELASLTGLSRRLSYAGLFTLLNDPRIEQVFGDGRIHLRRGATFDIIEADALRPGSAYSGNLYSDAYFALVRAHLAPNGLAATWAPTQRVHNTFIRAFPHVIGLPGILIGSGQPIQLDRQAIAARLADPGAREYFAAAAIDVERLVTGYLRDPIMYGPAFPRETLTDINTDLFPKDEFDLSPR